MAIVPVARFQYIRSEPSFCSKLHRVTEIIVQMAVRLFFITGSFLMAAATLPLSWHAVALPTIGLGTTLLASFFFPPEKPHLWPSSDRLQPLLRSSAVLPLSPNARPADFPLDAPRGLHNEWNNCAFNSLVHFLDSDPQVHHWFRNPLTAEMDMAAFRDFLAGYNPPAQLMDDFEDFVNRQDPPRRSIPELFDQFITYRAEENALFLKIKETYKAIRLLQGPFSQFFANYDQAMHQNLDYVYGTQLLRSAISQKSSLIRPEARNQEDAPEVLTQILDVLPDTQKVKVEESTKYEQREPRLALRDATSRKEDQIGYFTLELKEGTQSAQLQDLFNEFCDYNVEHPASYEVEREGVMHLGTDGQQHRYKPERRTIRILEAPPALRFQIKRFYTEKGPTSWYSSLFPDWFPLFQPKTIKRTTPVEAPEEMDIRLASGEVRRYRLVSFINQHGDSVHGGHYKACRVVNGNRYLLDDARVSLINQQRWQEEVRQAYLLCYLPVAGE